MPKVHITHDIEVFSLGDLNGYCKFARGQVRFKASAPGWLAVVLRANA